MHNADVVSRAKNFARVAVECDLAASDSTDFSYTFLVRDMCKYLSLPMIISSVQMAKTKRHRD